MDIDIQESVGTVGIALAFCSLILERIGSVMGNTGRTIIAGLSDSTFSLSAVILSLAPKQGLVILKRLYNQGYISRVAYDQIRRRIPIRERFQQN